ncbi:MAG TPA: cysteine--tRNA ligase [Candidatus Moranbacteria bacterium]|nr:cysteine--tRNA ligase [Candidatus Moranbacteria bacterium]
MLFLYNTLSKTKEEFKPINPGKVGMYVCGPTVYDHCHLGHARGYVSMDILRRYLEYLGFEVRHIMNYTDVGHLVGDGEGGEDKLEKRAALEKVDPIAIANKYITSVEEDFKALNIKPAHFNPRPTNYIAQIISFVEMLIQKGFAYEVNGSVYFSVEKFPAYGKLSGRNTEDMISGSRVEINPEKRNPLDFAVWIKASKEHLLKWESPWSLGYPGWHIECSVMSYDLLGQNTFDIHGGGNENKFPHNENEIAQSEAILEKPMANYWTHWNMVNIDGKKMSKSLNNFTTIKDALGKYNAGAIRLWIASSHYGSVIDYSEKSLGQAYKNFQKINDFVLNLEAIAARNASSDKNFDVSKLQEKFEAAMDDDLNTPLALSAIYEAITEINKMITENSLSSDDAKKILAFFQKMNSVFGFVLSGQAEIPEEIKKLVAERESARQGKDFKKSDDLRALIEKKGYIIEDTKDGSSVKQK